MKTNIIHSYRGFFGREGRPAFIAELFPQALKEVQSVLDVGCDDNRLKDIYGDKVLGIDVGGSPDKHVNLEERALRDFQNNSFETVVCTEVLEHLENFHEMMKELNRVSSKYLLISLPNCTSYRRRLRGILTGYTGKYYGLPLHEPEDRHKWYFSYKEVIEFMEGFAKANGLRVEKVLLQHSIQFLGEDRPVHILKQFLLKHLVRIVGWNNFCESVYIILRKD